MRPDERDLDDEIRGHLALSVRDRVERGQDPASARLEALAEFGYVPAIRDSMRRVWYSRLFEAVAALGQDMRVGLRAVRHAKGLTATVVVTLALGIGANAAIFSVVRAVLLRPLVNRNADRLIYLRQGAPGLGVENLTFSVPEIDDFRSRVTSISAFGDFSTLEFPLVGFGEPRVVQAGVVSSAFFDVMGLRPILGRLLNALDDGPDAAGAAVLTHRFWSTALAGDPSVVGRTIRLGSREATVIGVLEPAVPYPAATEVIANVVMSPHHLGATMVTLRTHRMTELFGRLAPGATLDEARAELAEVHGDMRREHPDAYAASAGLHVTAATLGDQIAAPARTILLVLLASAGLVFVIACANVANLMLARSVRREGELVVRAALGASPRALRRTLLGESLVVCGAGAMLGVGLAGPFVAVVSRYAARFSVRANDVTVDPSLPWVGAALALIAAVALAYIPRLPSPDEPVSAGVRIRSGTNRRLRAFAVTQVALSFVLLAGAATLLASLVALQRADTTYDLHQVLAIDVPAPLEAMTPRSMDVLQEASRRIGTLPGVVRVAAGNVVPWRDAGKFAPGSPFVVEGHLDREGEDHPRALVRNITPGFFEAVGVPILAGRDFTDDDRAGSELVVMVSQSLATRFFPGGRAVDRRLSWTDPVFGKPVFRRVVGIVVDVDDEHVVPEPTFTVYHPLRQLPFANRLFVHATGDPYSLVAPVTRIIRDLSADQPVERAATLADVRAAVLAPERLNAFVFSAFGAVALLVAVVGVAGVLAFSVRARTREFGVRLAIGSTRRHLLLRVLSEGLVIVAVGIVAGATASYAFGGVAARYLGDVPLPGVLPLMAAAGVLAGAAVVAALLPAARASRVDVLQALRSE